MAKIVELESGTDPVEEVTDPKQKSKNETEEMLQRLMKKSYVLGLSTGMKTMCGSILEKMNQNKNLNPQKQLMLLRQWCNHNLAINSGVCPLYRAGNGRSGFRRFRPGG